MKYEAIVFDVSDTLMAYSPNYAKIFSDRLRSLHLEVPEEKERDISRAVYWASGEQTRREELGAPPISEEERTALMDEAAFLCMADHGVCSREALNSLRTLPLPEQKMAVIPGTLEVLSVLKDKYRLAIVSNHYTWLWDYLIDVGLAPFFEAIIISDMVGVAKPNVRIMQLVLEKLNLPAEDCLYVGDHPLDVQCSKQAGLDCAWIVTDGSDLPESIEFSEDYRITGLPDLLKIL